MPKLQTPVLIDRASTNDIQTDFQTIDPEAIAALDPMTRRHLIRAAAAAVALAGVGLSTSARAQNELVTMEGQQTSLMEHVIPGKWNLVMMWSVTCGICVRETPVMSQFYDDEKDGNVTVLGVSIDGEAAMSQVAQWMVSHDMRFPNFVGELITVASNFKALTQEDFRGTPTFVMFDPAGELSAVQPGPLKPSAVRKFIAKQA